MHDLPAWRRNSSRSTSSSLLDDGEREKHVLVFPDSLVVTSKQLDTTRYLYGRWKTDYKINRRPGSQFPLTSMCLHWPRYPTTSMISALGSDSRPVVNMGVRGSNSHEMDLSWLYIYTYIHIYIYDVYINIYVNIGMYIYVHRYLYMYIFVFISMYI